MKKISLYAAAILVASLGLFLLTKTYSGRGSDAMSRRAEVFTMMPERAERVSLALRAQALPCIWKVAAVPVSPYAVDMFADVLGQLPEVPSVKSGAVPPEADLAAFQVARMDEKVAAFAPRLAGLPAAERSEYDRTLEVLAQYRAEILQCAFDQAHGPLTSG
jgi:hypothetical protein